MSRSFDDASYEVTKDYGIVDEYGNSIISLREVSWFEKPPKLELRKWRIDDNGNEVPNKGCSFSEDGANTLAEMLVDNNFGDTNKLLTSLSRRDGFKRNLERVVNRKPGAHVSALAEAAGTDF